MNVRLSLKVAALCLAATSSSTVAQNLPVRGAEATLDVATWNLYFFGDDSRDPDDETQIANAVEVIQQSGIDLWSLQEIEDPEDFARLVDALGNGWKGDIIIGSSNNLHVAYIYKTSVVEVVQLGRILAQYSFEFAGRLPLQMEALITLPDTSFTALFIAIHMKCCSDTRSWEQRQEASIRLKNHIDVFYPDMPVFVLGDFNDELTHSITSGRPSPYENFIDDPDDYEFATRELSENGKNTYCASNACTSGSTIDHILISDELFDAYVRGSADTYASVLDSPHGIPDYRSSTSDHLPVFAHFDFSYGTRTENAAEHRLHATGIFPNPVRDTAILTFSLPAPGRVSIEVFDILGRSVHSRDIPFALAGSRTLRLTDLYLPSGAYVLQIRLVEGAVSTSFIVLR